MNRNRLLPALSIAACLLFSAVAPLSAQSLPSLAPSAQVPVADGKIEAGEYSWHAAVKDMKLELSLSADSSTLYAALEAPTAGWVAVGLGSLRMNGAFMVMGYDNNGTRSVSEQTGAMFGHKENKTLKLRKSSVLEQNKVTTLEFAVPAAEYLSQSSLKLLVAYGTPDNFTTKHLKYGTGEVPLQKAAK
ncbi:MAG TPA: DOMON domain-containing protein [Rectinemataceae bacterium]|nr:DOMON domain-containing protein [Rectinemataceae bacterium]